MIKTVIEILDSSLNKVTEIKSPYPLDKAGTLLRYSKELSDFGRATFRISTYDTIIGDFGDIITPHAYHVRIKRGSAYVWQGAIIENTRRTKDFIEVVAVEYIWYFSKLLIHRTSPDSNGTQNIYRIFNSGTMATAVTNIITDAITDYTNTNHILKNLQIGTIDTPNYPPNMKDANNPPHALTGPWSFGDGTSAPLLTFDFHTVLYVLKSFGAYTFADFQIIQSPSDTTKLQFNFRSFLGNDRHYDINLYYGKHGNIIDFNIPRLGQRLVNEIYGIATDNNGVILTGLGTDESSKNTNGILQGVAAYTDVKDQASLNARIQAELPLISNLSNGPVNMTLANNAPLLGTFDVGDIINVQVQHTAISYNQIRRIVGMTVILDDTGNEMVAIQTNKPLDSQYRTS